MSRLVAQTKLFACRNLDIDRASILYSSFSYGVYNHVLQKPHFYLRCIFSHNICLELGLKFSPVIVMIIKL